MKTRQVAINFIKTLSTAEKDKMKTMLAHNVLCGTDYARKNEIEPVQFTNELKLIFEGK